MLRYYCTIGAQRALIYYSICQKWSSHKSYGAKSALASVSKRWNVSSKKGGPPQKGTRFSSTPSRAAFLFTQKITHFLTLFMCQLRGEALAKWHFEWFSETKMLRLSRLKFAAALRHVIVMKQAGFCCQHHLAVLYEVTYVINCHVCNNCGSLGQAGMHRRWYSDLPNKRTSTIAEFWEKTLTNVLWLFLASKNYFNWLPWFLALCTK